MPKYRLWKTVEIVYEAEVDATDHDDAYEKFTDLDEWKEYDYRVVDVQTEEM